MIIHNNPGPPAMTGADFKAQLKSQRPDLLRQDAEIRSLVLQTVEHYCAQPIGPRLGEILPCRC